MFNRRTVSAMLAGTVVAPSFALAKGGKQASAFYSGVGNELTHYEVDVSAAELARRGSIKMPGGIQYAWSHPSKKFLYVTSSTGGPGFNPGPGFPANQHNLAAFRIGPTGELTQHGDMITLKNAHSGKTFRARIEGKDKALVMAWQAQQARIQ